MRGNLSEGHFLTFEANGKALSHKDQKKVGSADANKDHDAKDTRFVLWWQGKNPKDNSFLISNANKQNRMYITSSLDLSSKKKDAARFSIMDLGNGKGHLITNIHSNLQLTLDKNGTVSMKESGSNEFKVYSVTF